MAARAHYRVVYPESSRPVFREYGLGVEHLVIDCSERGLRYRSVRRLPAVGSVVEGKVEFPDGERQRVSGVVVRVVDCEVALYLRDGPIPFVRIIQQERHLRLKS